MSETMAAVFDILEPMDHLDAPAIAALRSMFSERLISEFTTKRPKDLAPEIISRRDECGFPKEANAVLAAKALLDFMKIAGYIEDTPAAAPVPTEIKLVQDKSLADMNLRELLTVLRDNPARYNELASHLRENMQVFAAEQKSPNWAVATTDGKLDVDATVERVEALTEHTIIQAKLADGRYPMPLARVFGKEERYMINPFATSLEEAAVRGPIHEGYDLGNLPDEVHLAYIWAAFAAQNCKAWPDQIDPWEHIPQAFAESLSGRWQAVVEDYRAAKRNGDPSTEGLTRYMSPAALGSRRPFGGSSKQTDDPDWCRLQLEKVPTRGKIDTMNSTARMGAEIVEGAWSMNGHLVFDQTIVLGPIGTANGNIKGEAYVPRGTQVSSRNGNVSARVLQMSWPALYAKAVELGIITE